MKKLIAIYWVSMIIGSLTHWSYRVCKATAGRYFYKLATQQVPVINFMYNPYTESTDPAVNELKASGVISTGKILLVNQHVHFTADPHVAKERFNCHLSLVFVVNERSWLTEAFFRSGFIKGRIFEMNPAYSMSDNYYCGDRGNDFPTLSKFTG